MNLHILVSLILQGSVRHLEHRAAMAQAGPMRHPGTAAIIARRNYDPRVIMAIVLFRLVSIILCTIYMRWEAKAVARARTGEPSSA